MTRGGGGASFNFYVDSVNGSDANDGLTAQTAFATIAKLQTAGYTAGQTIGLARGSYWQEVLKPSVAVNIIAYGDGLTPPTFDGADVIAHGAFTLSADPSAAGVVYETTLSRAPTSEGNVYVSKDTYMMWEDGAWLTRVTSVAACAATPGTFYLPQPEMLSTPSTAYVHPFGSTNPTSDGKTYEYSKRSSGIEMNHLNGCTIRGIHAKRGGGAYGSITFGFDTLLDRCLSSYGGKHNYVGASGVMRNCIAFDAELARSVLADGGMIPFTFYSPDVAGYSNEMESCMAIFPVGRTSAKEAVYAHSSNGTRYVNAISRGFISLRGGELNNASASDNHTTIGACFLEAATTGVRASNRATSVTVTHLLYKGGTAGTGINHASAGGVTGTSLEFAHNAIYVPTTAASGDGPIISSIAAVVHAHHNTVFSESQPSGLVMTVAQTTSVSEANVVGHNKTGFNRIYQISANVDSNDNAFLRTSADAATRTQFFWGATTYNGFAAYKTASNEDLNSVELNSTALFLNNLAGVQSGDFRLTGSSTLVDGTPVTSLGCQEHWDFNARAIVAGAPEVFPTPPATEAECEAYILDPEAWDFYP